MASAEIITPALQATSGFTAAQSRNRPFPRLERTFTDWSTRQASATLMVSTECARTVRSGAEVEPAEVGKHARALLSGMSGSVSRMAVWRIVDTRSIAEGAEGARAWSVDVEERQTALRDVIHVDRVGDHPFDEYPDECRRAMRTQGRSVVQKYLDAPRMPRRIALTIDGVRPDFGDAAPS